MRPCLKKRPKSEKINLKSWLLVNSRDLKGTKAGDESSKAQGAGQPDTIAQCPARPSV